MLSKKPLPGVSTLKAMPYAFTGQLLTLLMQMQKRYWVAFGSHAERIPEYLFQSINDIQASTFVLLNSGKAGQRHPKARP
jgi:hypothetical protein